MHFDILIYIIYAVIMHKVLKMKRARQQHILEIIRTHPVAAQEELVSELLRRHILSTQSSVSRDITELGLVKVNGHYAAPEDNIAAGAPIVDIAPAGDNLIVVRTEVGQAQPTALRIDRARINEIVGTVAGDDTIFVAVPDASAQRTAIKKVVRLFSSEPRRTELNSHRSRSKSRKTRLRREARPLSLFTQWPR